MRYVLTLTNITRSESETIGFRAVDLSVLKEKGFNVPLSFVVNNEAYEDFLAENGLRQKAERIMLETPDHSQSFEQIISLFLNSTISKDLQSEILEAYESLSVEPGVSASSIVRTFDFPLVTLIRSPSYLLPTEDVEGILQNIKGPEQLLAAVKLIWASTFSPASREYRAKHQISERFAAGIIVEKMKKSRVSAEVYSRTDFNEFMIRVKSFKGLLDYEDTVLGKDVHDVDSNSLMIRNSQVNVQEFEITQDIETGELVKRQLLDEGGKQKLNEKIIVELARLGKRSKSFIGRDLKLYITVYDDVLSIVNANRMIIEKKTEIEETELVEVSDEDGKRQTTIAEDIEIRETEKKDTKFSMPSLLSLDEAKGHVEKEEKHRLFSLEGFDEGEPAAAAGIQEPEQTQLQPQVEIVDIGEQANSADQIQKESELLGHVLKIKQIIERMEEHAAKNNKEAYEQESRRLMKLLLDVRD